MLGRIGIPTKLVLGVIAKSCIGFVAVAGVALSFLRSSMLEDRYTKVRSLTEAALRHCHALPATGRQRRVRRGASQSGDARRPAWVALRR